MATIKLNWSICPFCDCFGKTVLRRIDWEEFEEHPNIFDFCCLRKLHNSYVLFFKTTTLCSLKVQFWSVAVLSKTNITNTYRTFHQFSLIVAMHHYSILKEYNFQLCKVFFQRTPALPPNINFPNILQQNNETEWKKTNIIVFTHSYSWAKNNL